MATVRRQLSPEDALFQTTLFPQYIRNAGTNFPITGLAYDTATAETAYWRFIAFAYGSGNITVDVLWYADTASTGAVVFEAAIAAITPDTDTQDVETKAFATAANTAKTHLGTTGQRVHRTTITVTALDSIAANDVVILRVGRLPANAGDTMAGDAIVIGVNVSYSDV